MKNLYSALLRFQREVGPIAKNARNDFHKSQYSTLDQLLDTARPVLCDCGLGIYQAIRGSELYTILYHESGEQIESVTPIDPLLDRAGLVVLDRVGLAAGVTQKQNVLQAYGAAITYLRRYSLFAILGLAPDDDDGNGFAGQAAPVAKRKPGPEETKKLPPPPAPPRAKGRERERYLGNFGTPEELQAFFDERRAQKGILEKMDFRDLDDERFFQLADLFIQGRRA